MIGKLCPAVDTIFLTELKELHEKLSPFVILSKENKPHIETAQGLDIERSCIKLLQLRPGEPGYLICKGLQGIRHLGQGTAEKLFHKKNPRPEVIPRIKKELRQTIVDEPVHNPLSGAMRKPNPVAPFSSKTDPSISMASSRCDGGMTKRSSKFASDVSL